MPVNLRMWRPAPPRKVSRFAEPCPRKALAAAIEASGHSYAAFSRMIRRSDGYLARFVHDGVPVALSPQDHQLLADHFGVEPRGLGIRDVWVHSRAA